MVDTIAEAVRGRIKFTSALPGGEVHWICIESCQVSRVA